MSDKDKIWRENNEWHDLYDQLKEKIADLERTEKVYLMNREWIEFVKGKINSVGFVTELDLIDYRNYNKEQK